MSPVQVTISAPSTAEKGQAFLVQGTVFELIPRAGVTVTIYQGGTSKGTATTNSSGLYSKSITINQTGTFPLLAKALGVYSNIDYITIIEPEPEPGWEYHSTYRGIDIQVWMPNGTPYTAYFDGSWHMSASLSTLKAAIDDFLEPEPEPPYVNSVSISAPASKDENDSFTITGRVLDQFGAAMAGVTVSLQRNGTSIGSDATNSIGYYSKSSSISNAGVYTLRATADSKSASRTITINEPEPEPGWEYHSTYRGIDIQVWMPNGTPYTAYFDGEWHTAALLSTLQAAIDDFLEPAVGIPTTLTMSAPSKANVGEKFNVSGILYETEAGIPIPNQPINHSYNGKGLGSSITGVDGDYLKEVSVPESGVWTLKSEFPGTEGLQASEARVDSVVADTPIAIALQIAGSIATGLFLFIYGTS